MRGAAALAAALLLSFAAPLALAAPAPLPDRLPFDAPSPILPLEADGSIRHVASGYHFPARLASMPVRRKAVFAADDVVVQYTDRGGVNGDPFIDLIVYRATRPLAEEAGGMTAAILRHGPAMQPVDNPPPPPRGARDGISRWYHGVADGHPITTGFVIVERNGWWLAVRGSSPDEGGKAAVERLMEAVAAIDWRVEPKPPAGALSMSANDRDPAFALPRHG